MSERLSCIKDKLCYVITIARIVVSKIKYTLLSVNYRYLEVGIVLSLICLGLIYYRRGQLYSEKHSSAQNYRINPNYRGLGVGHNYSSEIIPNAFIINIRLDQSFRQPIIDLRYDFSVLKNGTYNILLILPFKLIEQTSSSQWNCIDIREGSALITRIKKDSADQQDYSVGGAFFTENTFIHGRRGRYLVVLPLYPFFGIERDINELQYTLDIPLVHIDFYISVNLAIPDDYQIFNVDPPYTGGPLYLEFEPKNVMIIHWDLSETFLQERRSIIVYFESPSEIQKYQDYRFLSGLYLGIGIPLIFQGIIEAFRYYHGHNLRYSQRDE